MEASLTNVYGIDRFGEVSEETEMVEVVEVPGLHGMETKMGASTKVVEVEIGSKCFKDLIGAVVYEEVGVSQYLESLMVN